tara:strand:- start:381 stop:1844 length:1464 start_codon:yes stop_codon:yes gene_type:complete
MRPINATGISLDECNFLKLQSNEDVKNSLVTIHQTSLVDNYEDPTPPTKISDQLIKYQKLAQIKVSSSLATSGLSRHYTAAVKTNDCGRYLGKTRHGHVALNRCNRRSCPICATIKGNQYTRLITMGVLQMSHVMKDDAPDNTPDHDKMIGLKITLNTGTACTLDKLKGRLRVMHAVWSRMLKTRYVDDVCIGAFRATEITQTDSQHANPHLHGLIFVKADANTGMLYQKMKRYWVRVIKRDLAKLGEKIDTVAAFQQLEPLYSHTIDDVRDWAKYSTKGSYNYANEKHRIEQLNTTAPFWLALDDATKGMRLITCNGSLKDGVALAKEHLALKKVMDDIDPDIETTHAWSDRVKEFIPIDDFDPSHDAVSPLSQSLSYAVESPHLGSLFKMEYEAHKDRVLDQRIREFRKKLLTKGNDSIISEFDELFIYDIKKVGDDDGFNHYTEPVEIERKTLIMRSASTSSATNAIISNECKNSELIDPEDTL